MRTIETKEIGEGFCSGFFNDGEGWGDLVYVKLFVVWISIGIHRADVHVRDQ